MKSTCPNIACIKFLVFYLLQVCILTTCSKTFLSQSSPKAVETHTDSSQSQRIPTGEFTDSTEKQLAKALVEKNFHGDWHFVNSSSSSNATFNFFQHQEGILKISTSRTPDDEYIIDLLLVDGSNTDQKFLILSFHQNIFAKTLNKETSSFQLRDYPITYRKGDNFFTFTGFADKLQEVARCSLNAVTFSFWNAEKDKPFEVSKDKLKDMRVKIGIQSKDCGLEIEGMLVQNYGKKFHYQIWLYLALVGFCIISQVIGLIVHKNALNLELSLPHRFQLSFIITLNLQFVKMNLMFFGEYLYDFSRAWVFLLVALGFFSVFLLEMRILFKFVRDDQSHESYSWGPFAGIGLFVCFLMFNSDYYWILYPYIMTPLMDILQSYTCSKRWNYSFAFYFGYLLPYLPLIGYFKWYQGNFARFSPAPPVFHWCSFLIFFGLTWLIVRSIIKRLYPRAGEPQFKVIETYDGELDDCAICLEQLKIHEDKELSLENAKNPTVSREICVLNQEKIEKNSKKPSCEKILQTPCGHFFHKRCLKKWIQQKAVCPLCSRETPDSV